MALAVKRDCNRETEGGPHHLYGIAYALNDHLAAGGKLEGAWKQGRDYLDRHIELVRKYQLEDGSFSAAMFRGSRKASSPKILMAS